jgi:hypothetical protein
MNEEGINEDTTGDSMGSIAWLWRFEWFLRYFALALLGCTIIA